MDRDIKKSCFFFCIHENHLFSNSFGSLFPLIDILDVTFRSATGRQSARRQSQKKRSRRRDDDVLFVAFLSNHPDFESLWNLRHAEFLFLGFGKLLEFPGNKRQKAQAGTITYNFDIFLKKNQHRISWTFVHSPEFHHIHHFGNSSCSSIFGAGDGPQLHRCNVKPSKNLRQRLRDQSRSSTCPMILVLMWTLMFIHRFRFQGPYWLEMPKSRSLGVKATMGKLMRDVNFTGNHGLCKTQDNATLSKTTVGLKSIELIDDLKWVLKSGWMPS